VVAIVALASALALTLMWRLSPTRDAGLRESVLPVSRANGDSAVAVARAMGQLLVREADAGMWPVVSMTFPRVPSAGVRGVLSAARVAGMPVRWRDSTGMRELVLDVSALPLARPASMVVAHAQMRPSADSMALVIRDDGGVLDSASLNARSLRLRAVRLQGRVHADVMRRGTRVARASAAVPAVPEVRRVLIAARVGWESKFVMAALEETGWNVDGTFAVSPTARVQVGTPAVSDTARYSALIVLDSGVATAREVMRFTGQGGGVLVAGDAMRDPQMLSLMPARVSDDRPAIAGALLTDQPRRGLRAFHLRAAATAAVIEREGTEPVVVAARRGVGRIAVSGFRETWRWRMEGRDESADAHRQWWSDLVGLVAFSTDTVRALHGSRWPGDVAPMADLIARIGAPSVVAAPMTTARAASASRVLWLLVALATVALLTEWTLRRLRGTP
jgi:hypothetical protein